MQRIVFIALSLTILSWLFGCWSVASLISGVANANTFTNMDTFTSPLDSSNLKSLLSLPLSESKALLSRLPKERQRAVLRQLAAATQLKTTPEPTPTMQAMRQANLEAYYPHRLSRRQKTFLDLPDYEAFYGGAAFGCKTDALLAGALEFVHVPRYRAIIFRRVSPRLQEIIDRSIEWIGDKASWNQQRSRWTFPSGAKLQFGHMQHELDKYNFKTFEYQYCAFDELTEFTETQYLYMFSRVRRPKCQLHPERDPACPTCTVAFELSQVPLRIRSASNPDGEGREWVKKRFVSDEAADAIFSGEYGDLYYNTFEKEGRTFRIPFVPSRSEDNPGGDIESYKRDSLAPLDHVTRKRLEFGDWKTRPDSPIKSEWLRHYLMRGEIIAQLGPDGTPTGQVIDSRECHRFATIDTAGTDRLKAEEKRGKPPSYSVIAIWDWWPKIDALCLRHIARDRVGWNQLKGLALATLSEWGVRRVAIENAHFGPTLAAELGAFQVEMQATQLPGMADGYRGAKYERAAASGLLVRIENGQLLLPIEKSKWRTEYEAELLGWNGTSDEITDQIDVSSHAAWRAKRLRASSQPIVIDGLTFKRA